MPDLEQNTAIREVTERPLGRLDGADDRAAIAMQISGKIQEMQQKYREVQADAMRRGLPPPNIPGLEQALNATNFDGMTSHDLSNLQLNLNGLDQHLNSEQSTEMLREGGDALGLLAGGAMIFHGLDHQISQSISGLLASHGVTHDGQHLSRADLFEPVINHGLANVVTRERNISQSLGM